MLRVNSLPKVIQRVDGTDHTSSNGELVHHHFLHTSNYDGQLEEVAMTTSVWLLCWRVLGKPLQGPFHIKASSWKALFSVSPTAAVKAPILSCTGLLWIYSIVVRWSSHLRQCHDIFRLAVHTPGWTSHAVALAHNPPPSTHTFH